MKIRVPKKLTNEELRRMDVSQAFKATRHEWRATADEIGRVTQKKKEALEKLAKEKPKEFERLLRERKLKWARAKTINQLVK